MPKGIRGFQKGNSLGNKFKKGQNAGKEHYGYKGGKPHCKTCGKLLSTYTATYCQTCFHAFLSGENHPNWGNFGERLIRFCEICGKKILLPVCETKYGRGKYCSKECQNISVKGEGNPFYGKHHTEEYKKTRKRGKDSPIYGRRGKDCPNYGRKLSEEHRQKIIDNTPRLKGKDHPNYKGGNVKRICEVCGKEFSVKPSILKRINGGKYCSQDCRVKAICTKEKTLGKKHWNWRGGISFKPYPLGWTKTFREQIRYRDGYACQVCGCPEIENSRKLCVHHIDYDKKNLALDNLISLCVTCHAKTSHSKNREYWMMYFKKELASCLV